MNEFLKTLIEGLVFTLLIMIIVFSGIYGMLFVLDTKYNTHVLTEPLPVFKHNNIQNSHSEYRSGLLHHMARELNYTVNVVAGASMEPTIFDGDNFICDPKLTPQIGDIVLVNRINNTEYVHRIRAIYSDHVVTQGDDNNYIDPDINMSDIECVVVGVYY